MVLLDTDTITHLHTGHSRVILTADDINHYHRIVVALSETIRLMAEIDEVIDRHGGWPGAFATSTQESS